MFEFVDDFRLMEEVVRWLNAAIDCCLVVVECLRCLDRSAVNVVDDRYRPVFDLDVVDDRYRPVLVVDDVVDVRYRPVQSRCRHRVSVLPRS